MQYCYARPARRLSGRISCDGDGFDRLRRDTRSHNHWRGGRLRVGEEGTFDASFTLNPTSGLTGENFLTQVFFKNLTLDFADGDQRSLADVVFDIPLQGSAGQSFTAQVLKTFAAPGKNLLTLAGTIEVVRQFIECVPDPNFGFLGICNNTRRVSVTGENFALTSNVEVSPVPLPAGLPLLLGGLGMLGFVRRRKTAAAAV